MLSVRRLFFISALLIVHVCALLNVKPVRFENLDRHRPFAVLLKVLGRGIFGPQRRGTGWLLADRDGLFVVTAAHTFGYTMTEGDSVHIFAAVPESYRGAHQLYRLRREGEHRHDSRRGNSLSSSADHNENVAFVSFMNEADGSDQSGVPNDIAVIRLTGDNRALSTGTSQLALHQLPTNVSVLAKDTRLRVFGGASPQASHDTKSVVVGCATESNSLLISYFAVIMSSTPKNVF